MERILGRSVPRAGEGDRLDGGRRDGIGFEVARVREQAASRLGPAIMPPLGHIRHEQVHVEVIVVMAVATGAEHRIKLVARAREDVAQKCLLPARAAPPALDHGDLRAIREPEGGDVWFDDMEVKLLP